MNYSRRIVAGGLLCAFTGVLALVGTVNVLHADAETWTGQLALDRRLVQDSLSAADAAREPNCVKGNMTVQKAGIQYPVETQMISSDCWQYTSAGMYGDSGGIRYVKLGIASGAATDATYGTHELAGNRLIRTFLYSTQTGIRVYEKPALAAKFSQYGSLAHVVFSQTVAGDWTIIQPGTALPLSVGYHKVSSNGKWLIAESAGAFWRINLDTKEMVPFSSRVFPYGYGQDPHYYAAISDDGRYVAIAGGTSSVQEAYAYDLSGCDASRVVSKVAVGCKQRSIMEDMTAKDTTSRVANLYFNPTADTLFYSANEKGVWRRYSVSPAGTAVHSLEYLALGDSYSSGEGDGDGTAYYMPGTDGDGATVAKFQTSIAGYPYEKEKCHISTRSYPYLLAEAARLTSTQFHSVACSGATVNDVLNKITNKQLEGTYNGHFRQFEAINNAETILDIKNVAVNNFTPGRAAQVEIVSAYKPRVVTISMGGNDLGFGDILISCITSKSTSCDYATINKEQTAQDIETRIYNHLDGMYRDLKAASPTTQFYAIGYPKQFTNSDACDVNAQLDKTEREYAIHLVEYLNDIIHVAAANNGVAYLDIEDSLQGSNLCSGVDYPDINGLTMGNDYYWLIGSESYHPNESGHAKIAASIKKQLNGSSIATYQPCSNGQVNCAQSMTMPDRPAYFPRIPASTAVTTIQGDFILQGDNGLAISRDGSRNVSVDVTNSLFQPNSVVTAEVHSTPVSLGGLQVGADRRIVGTLTLPVDISLGYHTIHLVVSLANGEKVDMYQGVFVQASADDVDGDGVKNSVDPCSFVDPSGKDRDQDGIDDACDGAVGPAPVVTPPAPEPQPDPTPTPGPMPPSPQGNPTGNAVTPIDPAAQTTQPAVLASAITIPAVLPVLSVARIEPPEILSPVHDSSETNEEENAASTPVKQGTNTMNDNSVGSAETSEQGSKASLTRASGLGLQPIVISVAALLAVGIATYFIVHWRSKKNVVS